MPPKTSNGANGASKSISEAVSAFQAPAANSFLLSQKLALEAARFWARRAHAYAEQMQTLAACREPEQFVGAQTRFFERLREDYASEGEVIANLLTPTPVEHDAVVD